MAIAEKVGHDRRGNALFKRTAEGEEVAVEKEEEIVGLLGKDEYREKRKVLKPVIDDDLPSITSSFEKWLVEKQ
jgi:type I restriction enzyme M protein